MDSSVTQRHADSGSGVTQRQRGQLHRCIGSRPLMQASTVCSCSPAVSSTAEPELVFNLHPSVNCSSEAWPDRFELAVHERALSSLTPRLCPAPCACRSCSIMMVLGMLVWPTQAVLCYRMLPMQRSSAKVTTTTAIGRRCSQMGSMDRPDAHSFS